MAKKILYKVKAYHCPRCGSPTEPTKKYCDFCKRDLAIRSKNHGDNMIRLLVDCGNFIFFDEIHKIEFEEERQYLDATCLGDSYVRQLVSPLTYNFKIKMLFTQRGLELLKTGYTGIHKIRFENLGSDQSYECDSYIVNSIREITSYEMQTISFISVGNPVFGGAIPQEVLSEMRCPNCGAKITSRYGACSYCSGWIEAEW